MALAANSLQGGNFAAVRGVGAGSYASPFSLVGWLNAVDSTVTSYAQGVVLIANAGTLDEAGNDQAPANIAGILGPVSPRRQDQVPLTSSTAPAAALPRQRSTPSVADASRAENGGVDFADFNDNDWAVIYYPAMPGNLFTAHTGNLGVAANGGTDRRANGIADVMADESTNVSVGVTQTAGPASEQIQYATVAGVHIAAFGAAAEIVFNTVAFEINQPTTAAADAVLIAPGKLVVSEAGEARNAARTFNPRMMVVFIDSAWF